MCECPDYDDGSKYLCVVCADIQKSDALLIEELTGLLGRWYENEKHLSVSSALAVETKELLERPEKLRAKLLEILAKPEGGGE